MNISFEHKIYRFKKPSGTSRGVLTEKHAWFITIEAFGKSGIGECSVIPGLSPDFESIDTYENKLKDVIKWILKSVRKSSDLETGLDQIDIMDNQVSFLSANPSIRFGLEMAILDWKSNGQKLFFDNDFARGNAKIPINGLIWMGNPSFMEEQVLAKRNENFSCIKLKIGALPKQEEIRIIELIREVYPTNTIIRLDANGAFSPNQALDYFDQLSQFNIHSIEQPIAPGNWFEMNMIVRKSPIPIALDEELIGVIGDKKKKLLKTVKPHFIILKPSLHGGILGCREWIKLADDMKISWWMTSALESNHGLDCIAQFTAEFDVNKVHGLGTGSLYEKNEPTSLKVENGFIFRASL